MKKKELLFVWALFASLWCGAQQTTERYPLGAYEELTDTKPHDGEEVWNKMQAPVSLAWGSIDVRYPKLSIPLEVVAIVPTRPSGILRWWPMCSTLHRNWMSRSAVRSRSG